MNPPTVAQLDRALAAAEHLRDRDQDPDHLGRSLLYLAQRNRVLEALFTATAHYLNSGQDPHAHAQLLRALDKVRQPTALSDPGELGLG